jgi:hypothetical protein
MPLLPKSNVLMFLGGAGVVAYLAYEYKEKLAMNKKFKEALAEMRSPDLDTQTNGIESLVGYVSNNKTLVKDVCEHNGVLMELPQLMFSEGEDAQCAAMELLSLVSADDQGLDAIRYANIFPSLIAVLSSTTASDEALICAMQAVRNCTAPMHKTVLHPSTGQPVKVPIDRIPRSGNEDYEHEEEWFARELYQQHGLEPVINKILSEDPEIQTLALEIIINYCRTLKNQDEIGELGGIGFMLEIFTSAISPPNLKSLALSAIRHCVQSCACNAEQFRKAGGIKVLVTYFKTEAPKTIQGSDKQGDVSNAIKILNITLDSTGIEHIRNEQIIPQFVSYFLQDSNKEIKHTTVAFLKQLAQDLKCRKEISDAFKKKKNMAGNAGVPPSRYFGK